MTIKLEGKLWWGLVSLNIFFTCSIFTCSKQKSKRKIFSQVRICRLLVVVHYFQENNPKASCLLAVLEDTLWKTALQAQSPSQFRVSRQEGKTCPGVVKSRGVWAKLGLPLAVAIWSLGTALFISMGLSCRVCREPPVKTASTPSSLTNVTKPKPRGRLLSWSYLHEESWSEVRHWQHETVLADAAKYCESW